jgi:Uma2 family endonuclease
VAGTQAHQGYTVEDLWDCPDDGKRRELIDGVLYVTPMARTRHQLVIGWLTHRFGEWVEAHGGQIFPGVNVEFDQHTHLEPDLAVLAPGRETGDVYSLVEAPDLVVEVSSPSTKSYDLGVKRERYAQERAAEFWFVDLDAETVAVSVLTDAGYAKPRIHGHGAAIEPTRLPGMRIELDDILGPRA